MPAVDTRLPPSIIHAGSGAPSTQQSERLRVDERMSSIPKSWLTVNRTSHPAAPARCRVTLPHICAADQGQEWSNEPCQASSRARLALSVGVGQASRLHCQGPSCG